MKASYFSETISDYLMLSLILIVSLICNFHDLNFRNNLLFSSSEVISCFIIPFVFMANFKATIYLKIISLIRSIFIRIVNSTKLKNEFIIVKLQGHDR
jgi:hypothetical protein